LIRITFTDIVYPDVTNSHALWNACVDQYESVYVPLTEKEYERVTQVVEKIKKEIIMEDVRKKLKINDVEEWTWRIILNIRQNFIAFK
jgi:hypothetical protein